MAYEQPDYTRFREILDGEDNLLHPGIGYRPQHLEEICWQPTVWFGAVACAGEVLRQNPREKLADAPIDPGFFGDTPTAAQAALLGIVNASLRPVIPDDTAPDSVVPAFDRPATSRVSTCDAAETLFDNTFRSMDDPARQPLRPGKGIKGWDYVTDAGAVIGIQKRQGERTLLSLAPFVVNGIPYPAGSLYRAEAYQRKAPTARQNTVLPASRIVNLSFLRLSMYAAPQAERLEALDSAGSKVRRSRHLPSLDAVRNIAGAAFERHLGHGG